MTCTVLILPAVFLQCTDHCRPRLLDGLGATGKMNEALIVKFCVDTDVKKKKEEVTNDFCCFVAYFLFVVTYFAFCSEEQISQSLSVDLGLTNL